jgi:hypothetical protein
VLCICEYNLLLNSNLYYIDIYINYGRQIFSNKFNIFCNSCSLRNNDSSLILLFNIAADDKEYRIVYNNKWAIAHANSLNAIQHDYNQISTKLEVELKTLEDTKDKMNSNKVVFNRDSYLYCFFQNQYLAAKSLEIHDMLRLNNRWSEAEQFIEKNPECLSIIDEKVSYNTKTNGVHTIVSIRLLLKSFSAVAALTNFPSK